ncbi:ATP-binding protein [Labrenzia sp. 011]|uniref:sensor histidine kinase n=1 Tax=Labrenzia sp. 011 TaxID=2171494 RepID=UPI000D5087E0|nr:ATP-binding protein [Labrenzia sp. 011]PVB60047.1 sensor histidine kinase [Labrenzia sp. 011]
MTRGSRRRAWRNLKLGIGAAMVAASLAILWLTGLASLRLSLAEIETRAEANLAVQAAVLERLLDKFRLLSPLLARGPETGRLVSGRDISIDRTITSVAAGMSGAEEVWLMDPLGRVIVTSQHGVPFGAIGGAAAISEAFEQASQGQLGRQLIPGNPQSAASYIFASPLRNGDRLIGILAVRVSLEDVEQAWALSKDPILALDEDGRVVVTNVPGWRGRFISDIDFGRNIDDLSGLGRLGLLLPSTGAINTHMRLATSLPVLGWNVATLVSIDDARQQSAWAMVAALLGCVIAAGGLWIVLLRREEFSRQIRRDKAAALRLERRVRSRTAELRKANELLEEEVREREQAETNLRLAQAELVQAAKLATLGRMSAALSHEYNQPLAAIRSDAEVAGMLIERGRAEEARANLARIGGMVARMAEIAKTLKGFTRKSGTDIRPVSLRKVIDETLLLLQPQIKQSCIVLTTDLPETDIIVKGGQIRLEQVVINLLSNALDAVGGADRPMVALTLRLEGEEAVLRVRDNGPGIDGDVMPQIFDPFFTTKDVGAGLGLGLSIAYKIVHDFSGTLQAANRDDGGAEFTMRLPIADEQMLAAE